MGWVSDALDFWLKMRLSCSYVLSILGKIALFKRKECFCSYFFKLRLEPFLILGNLRLSVLTELFLLEKKRCCWKPSFICMHQAMINSFFYSKTTAHEQSRCFYFLLVFACEKKYVEVQLPFSKSKTAKRTVAVMCVHWHKTSWFFSLSTMEDNAFAQQKSLQQL